MRMSTCTVALWNQHGFGQQAVVGAPSARALGLRLREALRKVTILDLKRTLENDEAVGAIEVLASGVSWPAPTMCQRGWLTTRVYP